MSHLDVLDLAAFDRTVPTAPRPVAVLFSAPWCGPCRTFAPLVARVGADLGDRLDVVKVDTEATPELAIRFAIRSLPTLIVMRGGEVVSRTVGTMTEGALRKLFEGTTSDVRRSAAG